MTAAEEMECVFCGCEFVLDEEYACIWDNTPKIVGFAHLDCMECNTEEEI